MTMKTRTAGIFLFSLILITFALPPVMGADNLLKVDIRHRPPEMMTGQAPPGGPLLDIIAQAAAQAGYDVKFQERQFRGSLEKLKAGDVDIVPRTICTPERARDIDFIGPIGYQKFEIMFLVKAGHEESIKAFEDLKKIDVGVKKGTFYFDAFNNDPEIRKVESKDDDNMVQMFAAGRFDAMAILDIKATEEALKRNNIRDYAFSIYKHTSYVGNYYGIAPRHAAKEKLQKILEEMVVSGKVTEIYEKYGAEPPSFDPSVGFVKCAE